MDQRRAHVTGFYARHPISAAQVLAKVEAARGSLANLSPASLWPHDQDHYGGLKANRALARAAGLRPGMQVADFCAGLGGPARWYASSCGVKVTGIDLTPERVAGAADLNARTGMDDRVRVIEGDVTATGLADGAFDAVLSQEAFLHLPDKFAALSEAQRLLKPGGCLAFTDWVAHRPIAKAEAETLWQGIAAQGIQSPDDYAALFRRAGFALEAIEDLTLEWGEVLAARLAMYTKLREETRAAGLPAGDEAFYGAYVKLVAMVQARVLGGMRFVARKPA